MNLDWFVRQATRAAIWQLARRSPTWLLIGIVLGAALYSMGHR
jgi:hypothetical protein